LYNRIVGNTHGLVQSGSGTVQQAKDNWWGCNAGPGNAGCDTVSGTVPITPILTLSGWAQLPSIAQGSGQTNLYASLFEKNTNQPEAVPSLGVLFGLGTVPPGTLSVTNGTLGTNDQAQSLYTANPPPAVGTYAWTVTLDNQVVSVPLTITAGNTGIPLVTTVISPTNAVVVSRPITLTWTDVGAAYYKVQVISGTVNGPLIWNNSNATGGSTVIPSNGLPVLPYDQTYYWKVKSCNLPLLPVTCSVWSNIGSFTLPAGQ
jgi:hypothetical protein